MLATKNPAKPRLASVLDLKPIVSRGSLIRQSQVKLALSAHMASHQNAIARASFAAGLLRPDFSAVSRDEIANFHQRLDAAVLRCTSRNIQTCKDWLLKNVIPSFTRTVVLAKYLLALAKSFQRDASAGTTGEAELNTPPERKVLHILYLLNDLFHHTKHHKETSASSSSLTASFEPFLVELVSVSAAGARTRVRKRLEDLLYVWVQASYLEKDYEHKLHGALQNAVAPKPEAGHPTGAESALETGQSKSNENVPFVMPPAHGDPAAPFYDLPAGNLMPHIVPNSTIPVRPQAVKALQFLPGPADDSLVNAVKDFLRDVEKMDDPIVNSENGGDSVEIDAMGQLVVRDETGEIDLNASETYYGWSRAFCEKMRKRGDVVKDNGEYNGSRRSYSSSRSRSRSPRKRRRYSDDGYSGRSDSRSRSRSRQPPYRHKPYRPPSRSVSRSRSRSYSPAPAQVANSRPPVPSSGSFVQTPPPPPPPPSSLPHNMPFPAQPFPPSFLGPDGMPLPPPRPPNYHGPWPPPPPPLSR